LGWIFEFEFTQILLDKLLFSQSDAVVKKSMLPGISPGCTFSIVSPLGWIFGLDLGLDLWMGF